MPSPQQAPCGPGILTFGSRQGQAFPRFLEAFWVRFWFPALWAETQPCPEASPCSQGPPPRPGAAASGTVSCCILRAAASLLSCGLRGNRGLHPPPHHPPPQGPLGLHRGSGRRSASRRLLLHREMESSLSCLLPLSGAVSGPFMYCSVHDSARSPRGECDVESRPRFCFSSDGSQVAPRAKPLPGTRASLRVPGLPPAGCGPAQPLCCSVRLSCAGYSPPPREARRRFPMPRRVTSRLLPFLTL